MKTDKHGAPDAIYPVQCKCGHIYLEMYALNTPSESGAVGFCWCGWCRTRLNVYPRKRAEALGVENEC